MGIFKKECIYELKKNHHNALLLWIQSFHYIFLSFWMHSSMHLVKAVSWAGSNLSNFTSSLPNHLQKLFGSSRPKQKKLSAGHKETDWYIKPLQKSWRERLLNCDLNVNTSHLKKVSCKTSNYILSPFSHRHASMQKGWNSQIYVHSIYHEFLSIILEGGCYSC